MPARSNLHQAVIFYVKQHLAPPGVEVTESMLLPDQDSGIKREVDIVLRGSLAPGDPITISIEVVGKGRKADLPWVESMLRKHERMPTNRLVLISWSGFTKPAMTKVENQGGRVVALSPVEEPRATVPQLQYQQIRATPETVIITVRNADGEAISTLAPAETNLYLGPSFDDYVCSLRDWFVRILNENALQRVSEEVLKDPNKEALNRFTLSDNVERHGLFVHTAETGFLPFLAYITDGAAEVSEQPMDFTVMRLDDTLFAMTSIVMAGQPAVWVLTDNGDGVGTLSWRLV